MAASERVGQVAATPEVAAIEAVKQAVIEHYDDDVAACFLYKPHQGPLMIMTIDQAFEISGSHIRAGLGSSSPDLVQSTWDQLDRLKNGADKFKTQDQDEYERLVGVGEQYLEGWRQRQAAS